VQANKRPFAVVVVAYVSQKLPVFVAALKSKDEAEALQLFADDAFLAVHFHNAAENGLIAVMEALAAMGADLNAATKARAPFDFSVELTA